MPPSPLCLLRCRGTAPLLVRLPGNEPFTVIPGAAKMKSGAGVLLIASLQLIIGLTLLGIFEGYKVSGLCVLCVGVWTVARPLLSRTGRSPSPCRHRSAAPIHLRFLLPPIHLRACHTQTHYFNSGLSGAEGEGLSDPELKQLAAGECSVALREQSGPCRGYGGLVGWRCCCCCWRCQASTSKHFIVLARRAKFRVQNAPRFPLPLLLRHRHLRPVWPRRHLQRPAHASDHLFCVSGRLMLVVLVAVLWLLVVRLL